MNSLPIQFPNHGGEQLAARLDLPAFGPPTAYAIFAHCFTCTKEYNAPVHVSRALQQQGLAVLRFDFTGLGHSEGAFADTNFSSMVADSVAAAEYLAAHYMAPQLLIGHSWGGAAVVQASRQLPTVRAVVTLGAPASPLHITHHFTEQLAEIEAKGSATVQVGGQPAAGQERIKCQLALTGPLSAEQRTRLLEIAGKCPVHQTLHANVPVVTSLGDE